MEYKFMLIVLKIITHYISIKTFVVGTQKNCLNENPKHKFKLARKKIQYCTQKFLTGPIGCSQTKVLCEIQMKY